MKSYNNYLIAVIFAITLGACRDGEKTGPVTVTLIDSSVKRVISAQDIQLYLSLSGLKIPLSALQYNVTVYSVTYHTTYKGQPLTASGLVSLPSATDSVGMISFQHGTLVSHSEAPSVLSATSQDVILYASLASPGLIAAVPDYLGFGSSSNQLHPYYVKEATASSILDLLKAAKELATLHQVKFNGKLFLAGYSEGGFATMAAHRAIELQGLPGFSLRASFPAAGGYDVKGMQEYFFGLTTYDQPFYIAYAALAYQNFYTWTAPLSDFFQSPYSAAMPGLFDGSKDGSQINALLTDSVKRLISTDLLAHIDTSNQYQYIVQAFNDNSLTDWAPGISMYLYHGDADTTVPYQNSVDTFNKLIENGASKDVLTLTTLSGKNHESGVYPYLEDFVPKILSLK